MPATGSKNNDDTTTTITTNRREVRGLRRCSYTNSTMSISGEDNLLPSKGLNAKKIALVELIDSTFEGNTNEAMQILGELRNERKSKKKGPLYNRKGVNQYAFVITIEPLFNLYQKALQCFWHGAELNPSADLQSWKHDLSDDERHFLKNTLAFFATADGIVNDNIITNFREETDLIEVVSFYNVQLAVESVHNEVYGKFLNTYIEDEKERNLLLNGIKDISVVKKKIDWAQRWIHSGDVSFGDRLVAFACVEGIFFSGSFASIFWLKNRKGKKLLPEFVASNEYISRDEGLHMIFAITLTKYLDAEDKPTTETVHEIVKSAVALELEFVSDSLRVDLVGGMTVDNMKKYILHTADYLLDQLEVPKIYNVSNPFNFMNSISIDNKTNFFESRVTDYTKHGRLNKIEIDDDEEDF